MIMKKYIIILTALIAVTLCSASCDDWTDNEKVEQKVTPPEEQDPAAWARYVAELREYKKTAHAVTFALFDNAPKVAVSERDFLRCLPDSLDAVSLTNADNLSEFDLEDMPGLREKGTKILYHVDYAERGAEWSDAAALGTYLDKVAARIAEYDLDGASFTGIPRIDGSHKDVATLLVSKLALNGKMLVFVGDPTFIAPGDREKVSYFMLDSDANKTVTDLKMDISFALDVTGIPADKLLLGATAGKTILDEEQTAQDAILEMARRVLSEGPLAGMGVMRSNNDYYNSTLSYKTTRTAIQMLNPSPVK